MSGKKILVIDDEKPIRDMLDRAFSRAGYVVQTADSAESALDAMETNPCWVLFVDLNLPGMSGVEFCKRIRNEYPMAILVAFTGQATLFELTDCRNAGFEDYFTKPAELSELLAAAEHAFGKLERWTKRQRA
ncbi:MAG: response regulator [Candidatus Hydrogenedentes bacterium]|nr:response regulator [Candidatus Hydrogenedentota bacterium]